jgi:hypothetical protein
MTKEYLLSFSLSHATVFDFIQKLTSLDLRGNQIGDQGAKHLSDALLHNTVRQKNFFFLVLFLIQLFSTSYRNSLHSTSGAIESESKEQSI